MTGDLDIFAQMRLALQQWVQLDDRQFEQLRQVFHRRQFENRAHIVLPGSNRHQLFFVGSGLLRFYYLTPDGQESNKAFISEDMFAGALAAHALDLPVLYGVQAMENTLLLEADYRDFSSLFDLDPVFDRLGRKIAEWMLTRKELRARSLLQQQALERYRDFVKQYAHLLQRIPQYHIASYLGITEVSLSRLRKNL